MNAKIKSLLNSKGGNYIAPFLWLHGEEEQVLREYMNAIHSCGIRAVCIESRPHPDFCGKQWWQDLDIILGEAKKHNMKVWILDDRHFPTGYANGAMEEAPAELCRQYLYYSSVEVLGPMNTAQLDITKHVKYMKDPMKASRFNGDDQKRRMFNDDTLLSVCAVRVDNGFDASSLIDITNHVTENQLVWDVPPGRWCIYINFLTRNAGLHDGYINLLSRESVRKLINAVYEPHFEHYKEEFGITIEGFFSDEPGFGNGEQFEYMAIGEDQDLPFSSEVEEEMFKTFGEEWKCKLPMLWQKEPGHDEVSEVRRFYMDIVTRLAEKNFSMQIGTWCDEHGVKYIGHMIEDNNAHSRLGDTMGHYFRGLSGQHMSGIDEIRNQIMPAGEVYPLKELFSGRDGEFYHYLLGKLGSSSAAIDPRKKGRSMCELFGAAGWSEGVRWMKYLVDHFLVRGINHYVPHAFSAKEYPDIDCPPHFYANGHDPQFRHFTELMRYLNRVCMLINNGSRIAPAAILYHAEAEWMGDCMLSQKPAHILMDHQIDFDILPLDIFFEKKKYGTVLGKQLQVNGNSYKVLLVPYTRYITSETANELIELARTGFPVVFIDDLPERIIGSDNKLRGDLAICKVWTLDNLVGRLTEEGVREIEISPEFSMLRYLHYREESDIFIFTNENMFDIFRGTVTIPITGNVYGYDAWNNEVIEVKADRTENATNVSLEVHPYQSLILVFDETDEVFVRPLSKIKSKVTLNKGWTMSMVSAINYPAFSNSRRIDEFKNIGLGYPAFSGIIRYEKMIEFSHLEKTLVSIDEAYEGVEVFVNDKSVGIQVVPPFLFDISKQIMIGTNKLRIEVATTRERERYFVEPDPRDWKALFAKGSVLSPIGIMGDVKLFILE